MKLWNCKTMKSRRDANFFLKFRQQGNFFLLQCGAVFGLPWTITPTTSHNTLLCYIFLLSGCRAQYKCYNLASKNSISLCYLGNTNGIGITVGQQNRPQTLLHHVHGHCEMDCSKPQLCHHCLWSFSMTCFKLVTNTMHALIINICIVIERSFNCLQMNIHHQYTSIRHRSPASWWTSIIQ